MFWKVSIKGLRASLNMEIMSENQFIIIMEDLKVFKAQCTKFQSLIYAKRCS